jgi:protocatechuate 3,4-dioxygenase alpha subunit
MMMDTVPTPSQTVGPFFHLGLTAADHCIRQIAAPQAGGERVLLTCRVFDGVGAPVPDAMIEIWQANAEGRYAPASELQGAGDGSSWRGFGRMPTDENGTCEFETVKPGRVPAPGHVLQAPHLEVAIFARGLLKQLFTRIYFQDDPANQRDPVLGLVPEDRRETLLAQREPERPGHWLFNIYLQGERETAFFDV